MSFELKSLGKYKGIGNRIFLTLSTDSTFAKIKSPWWRCCVCWKSVLDLFWQMFALSAWASYLKWQTVWCHLSNKNLWEFSFCSSFSSTSSIFLPPSLTLIFIHMLILIFVLLLINLFYFLLPSLILSKIRPTTKASACNALTGDSKLVFAPPGLTWIVQKSLPCCDYVAIRCPEKKEIRKRQNRNPGRTI